jgi:transcriptional regulator with PAS, ATPase and Fis domain
MNEQQVKQRFGIIGNSLSLDRAIDISIQVAPTDLSVLVTGESGTGKEIMPQVIHGLSVRKHNKYVAVNCGAIPEGTIDSELFGHVKGAFTGAIGDRKGFFEEADGGTLFLDEVAELPVQTQVRLLRVLETGEYLRVGSAKVQKTDVRIIAATNVNVLEAIRDGRFREDLYYRLNTVPIQMPSLRERREDIHLLFRKFARDYAEKFRMPPLRLAANAVELLEQYRWPGNIRQLKNIAEQISVIEREREVTAEALTKYLPASAPKSKLPVLASEAKSMNDMTDRDILYKVLFDMKKDMNDLKALVIELMNNRDGNIEINENQAAMVRRFHQETRPSEGSNLPAIVEEPDPQFMSPPTPIQSTNASFSHNEPRIHEHEEVEESLSLEEREIELIRKALKKNNNKRKHAAKELGISERTLYRKIKEYNIR